MDAKELQVFETLLREIKNLNQTMAKAGGGSSRSNSAPSRSTFSQVDFTSDRKELKATVKEFIKQMNEFLDHQNVVNKGQTDYVKNIDKINKQLKNGEADLGKQQKLQERRLDNVFRMADQMEGSIELMDKKAKDWAKVMASSSKTFGDRFKDFEGGLSDMQDTMREFLYMRSELAKKYQEESKALEESVKNREKERDATRALWSDLKEAQKNLANIKANPDPHGRGTGKANIEAAEREVEEIQKSIDARIASRREEIKYRRELKASVSTQTEFLKEIDETIDAMSKFGSKLFDATSAANLFAKEMDDGKRKFKDMAKQWSGFTTVSVIGGLTMMKDAALEIADKYRIVADVGMAGMMTEFSITAVKLGLTISQLSKIVGENRAAFAKSGMSVTQFGSMVKSNNDTLQSVGLSYEQSAAAQAKMMNGAISMLGSEQKRNSDAIRKSVNDQVKSFRVLSVATGETVDALAAEYDSMLKDEEMSKKLQSLNGKERAAAAQSMLLEYQHYKLLGLNNEQIKEAINLKNANQYRLGDRIGGATQTAVAMKAVGMSDQDANRARELLMKRNKDDTEMAELTRIMSDAQNKKNNIDVNGSDTQKEMVDNIFAGFSNNKVFSDAWNHGKNINAAQSNGSAQMTVAQANEQLIKAQSAGTDKMVAAYAAGVEKTNAAIGALIKQASPSNDKMARVGQATENVKAFADAIKDTPFVSGAKMLLGAAIALLAAARMLSKSDLLDSVMTKGKRGLKRTAIKGIRSGRVAAKAGKGLMSGAKGLGKSLLKKIPLVGTILGLGMDAKDIYDAATEDTDKDTKRKNLTKTISSAAGGTIGAIVGGIFGGPVGAMLGSVVGDFLGGMIGDGINYVCDHWEDITKWVSDKWNSLISWTGDQILAISTWFGKKWDGITGWVKKTWTDISKWTSDIVDSIWTAIQENPIYQFMVDSVNWVIDKWTTIKKFTSKLMSPLINAVKSFNPFGWIEDAMYWVLDKYIALCDMIPKSLRTNAMENELNALKQVATAHKSGGASSPATNVPGPQNQPAQTAGSASQQPMIPVKAVAAEAAGKAGWKPAATNAGTPVAAQPQQSGDSYLNSIISWNGGVSGDLSHFKKLDPGLQQRVVKYAEAYHNATGKKLKINSAFRTREEQAKISKQVAPGIAAQPGTSPHEKGIGIDIDPASIKIAKAAGVELPQFGLWQPMASKPGEFQHVQPAGVAANNRQAAELGILSPSAAVKGGSASPAPVAPPPAVIPPAPAASNKPAQTPAVPVTGNANASNNGSYGGGSGGSGGSVNYDSSGSGGNDVVSLLAKIASLNTAQLAELQKIVSSTKTSTTTSLTEMMRTTS